MQQKRIGSWQGLSSGGASGEATSGNYAMLHQGANRTFTESFLKFRLSSCPFFTASPTLTRCRKTLQNIFNRLRTCIPACYVAQKLLDD
jgi:hypothetical protein